MLILQTSSNLCKSYLSNKFGNEAWYFARLFLFKQEDTMSNKERWQKLAGIITEEDEDTDTLQENFKNLGIASPGIMGNPFERSDGRQTSITNEDYRVTGRPDTHGPLGDSFMQAEDLLKRVVESAEEYGPADYDEPSLLVVEADIIEAIKQFLER